jgi:Domain of unknown function (DUF4190)
VSQAPPPPPPSSPPPGPGPGQPYVPHGGSQTNGLAITSLVLGIGGFFISCLGLVAWILALVFGYRARTQIDETGGEQKGRGMAVAGIVLGWVGIGLSVLALIVIIIVAAADSS